MLRNNLPDGMALKLSLKEKQPAAWKARVRVVKAEGMAHRCTGSEIGNSLSRKLKEGPCSWSRVNRERAARDDRRGGQGACAGLVHQEGTGGILLWRHWDAKGGFQTKSSIILLRVPGIRKKRKRNLDHKHPVAAFPRSGILIFWHVKHIFWDKIIFSPPRLQEPLEELLNIKITESCRRLSGRRHQNLCF